MCLGVRLLVMLFVLFFRPRCFLLGSFRGRRYLFRLRFTTTSCFPFGFGVR